LTISPSGHPKYKWKFNRVEEIILPPDFYTGDPIIEEFFKLEVSKLTINLDYFFDGCTGAPDFSKALRGCGIHDALIQIYLEYGVLDIGEINKVMGMIHREDKFIFWRIYYWGVKLWWWKVSRRIIGLLNV
jgi:hypothetical protein